MNVIDLDIQSMNLRWETKELSSKPARKEKL